MNRRTALFAIAPIVAALFACHRGDDLKSLTVAEVSARLAARDGKTVAIDCNSKERFAKGHLPGARWVAYDAVSASDLPADKATTLVFYCANEL